MENLLDSQIANLSPNQYIGARRVLNQLKTTIKGLSDPLLLKACNDSWKQSVHNVSDLVGYCMKNGLQFGPAVVPGDYPCYSSTYYAIRNYEREVAMPGPQ